MKKFLLFSLIFVVSIGYFTGYSSGQFGDDILSNMKFTQPLDKHNYTKVEHHDFKGYTNHWDKFAWRWYRYAGLFQVSQTDIKSELWQMEDQVGHQLMLEELLLQKGFVSKLSEKNTTILRSPTQSSLENALRDSDVLLLGVDRDAVMNDILAKLPEDLQFRRNRAFYLEYSGKTLFVISCHTPQETERLYGYITSAIDIMKKYTLSKGMAGVNVGYFTITQDWKHPLDVIDNSLSLRSSWVMVQGYDDWMIPGLVKKWLKDLDFPFVMISGQSGTRCVMYGMDSYPQIQDNTLEECLDWT